MEMEMELVDLGSQNLKFPVVSKITGKN